MASSKQTLPAPVSAQVSLDEGSTASPEVHSAASWLASIPVTARPRPLIPHLKREFNLSAIEAVQVIRKASGGQGE